MIRLRCGELDLERREVRREQTVTLTKIETALLRYLAERPGEIVSREDLLAEIWGYARASQSQAVHVAIRRLRKKIERDPGEPEHLITVPGVGWRLELPRAIEPAVPIDPILGRQGVLDELDERLVAGAVVTLLGPGGIGKTRLGREVAERGSGVFVDLAASRSMDDVVVEVSGALGCSPSVAAVKGALSRREEPVVLDNFEQVVAFARGTVGEWVGGAPLLVTSRERLGVRGEQVLSVPALSDEAATELYVRRARASGARGPLQAHAVASLCRALEGNALCIELAASRARLLDPAGIEARLGDRFGVLKMRPDGRPERHLALEAALDWSWQLLEPEVQEALAALAVFRGGFTLEAAEAVLGTEALDRVHELLDASLLFERNGRFDLYVSVREFVERRVGLPEAAIAAHGAWCRSFYQDKDPKGRGALQRRAAMGREAANLAEAVDRAVARGEAEVAVEAVIVLTLIGKTQPVAALDDRIDRVLPLAEGDRKARLYRGLAWSRARQGRPREAVRAVERSLEACDELLQQAMGIQARSNLHIRLSDYDAAQGDLVRAIALFQELDRGFDVAACQIALGNLEVLRGRPAEGEPLLRAAAATYRATGDKRGEAIALGNLSSIARTRGRLDEAISMLRDAIAVCRAAGDTVAAALLLVNLGSMQLERGGLDEARRAGEEALEMIRGSDQRTAITARLLLAGVARRDGDLARARTLLVQGLRDAERFDDRRKVGAFQTRLGEVCRDLGEVAESERLLDAAVETLEDVGDRDNLIRALCARGATDDLERARTLLDETGYAPDTDLARVVAAAEDAAAG